MPSGSTGIAWAYLSRISTTLETGVELCIVNDEHLQSHHGLKHVGESR